MAYELDDSAVRDRGIVEELSARLQAPVVNHGIKVFQQARQCVRDELMNFLSRNMVKVEVFIQQIKFPSLGKLVTEKPVNFVGFDDVVEFNKTQQNDDNVVKAYKDFFS